MAAERHPLQAFHAELGHALALYNTGQAAAAEAHGRRLLAVHGPDPALLQLLAVLCQERGDPAQARGWAQASLNARPGHVPTLMVAALACHDLHDLAAAEAALQAVLHAQPEHVAAAVNLGVVHLAQHRLEDALNRFGLAYRLRPETFGRIAHALCAESCGALWADAQALRARLGRVPAAP